MATGLSRPAASYHHYQNVECPQFYPLFPFNQFSLGRNDIRFSKHLEAYGPVPQGHGAKLASGRNLFARMGMTKEAADYNTRKLLENSPRRYPTFWGPWSRLGPLTMNGVEAE